MNEEPLFPHRKNRCFESADGKYRWFLQRHWSPGKRWIAWVGLNPSTGNATQDDPTLRRMIRFSFDNFDGMFVVNLFAMRSKDPDLLSKEPRRVGTGNDRMIIAAARTAQATVLAWGAHKLAGERSAFVLALLRAHDIKLLTLGRTTNGQPRHPLFVRASQPLIPFYDAPPMGAAEA